MPLNAYRFLSIVTAAEIRGVTPTTITNWIHTPAPFNLPAEKFSDVWLIAPNDLAAYKPRRKGRPAKSKPTTE